MAAGLAERMQPLSYEVPKPLVRVNGTRMIDTVVDGLKANGINEIYVVIGHLKDQFYIWAKDKEVNLIENPYYDTCNNIGSLYVARQHLNNCMILDGDQIIYNKSILNPCFTLSGYNAVWREKPTKEWLMTVDNGVVTSCSREGGERGWQLYSISRWTAQDGEKLRKHTEYEFDRGNRQIYWDDVAMFCHFDEYKLGIREMNAADMVEIDSLEELIAIDRSYADYMNIERN